MPIKTHDLNDIDAVMDSIVSLQESVATLPLQDVVGHGVILDCVVQSREDIVATMDTLYNLMLYAHIHTNRVYTDGRKMPEPMKPKVLPAHISRKIRKMREI